MKSDKQLQQFYNKYINIPIYRVVSGWHYKDIIKKGINPKKDPYKKIKPKLTRLFKLVIALEKRGIILSWKSGDRKSVGSYWAKVASADLKKQVVDFTPKREHISYYKKIKGGAMVGCVNRLTSALLEKKQELSKDQLNLVKELNKWNKKRKINNKVIVIKGCSRIFEKALFQLSGLTKGKLRKKFNEKHYPSPFGSFKHFQKMIQKYGLKKYAHRLRSKKYYLRVKEKIPSKEIKRLK